jgi:hypothetical protein
MDYMISKCINGNTLELRWGQVADEMKYVGDDLWLFNAQSELVFVKFHIYSHFGANSRILRAVPGILKYSKMTTPLSAFQKTFKNILEEPKNHVIYKDNVIVNYPGAEGYKGAMNVYNPCHGFYVLTADDAHGGHGLHCIIQYLCEFELQMESKTDRIALSALDKDISSVIIELLAADWLYNDDEDMLPNMVVKWEERLNKIGPELPKNLYQYAYGIIEYWKEMTE